MYKMVRVQGQSVWTFTAWGQLKSGLAEDQIAATVAIKWNIVQVLAKASYFYMGSDGVTANNVLMERNQETEHCILTHIHTSIYIQIHLAIES